MAARPRWCVSARRGRRPASDGRRRLLLGDTGEAQQERDDEQPVAQMGEDLEGLVGPFLKPLERHATEDLEVEIR